LALRKPGFILAGIGVYWGRMASSVWSKVLENCPDPERARHYYEQFRRTSAEPELRRLQTTQAKVLAALFSGSQPLSEWLIAQPDWFHQILDPELLNSPRQEQGVRREVRQWLEPLLNAKDYPTACSRLREFKQREYRRVDFLENGWVRCVKPRKRDDGNRAVDYYPPQNVSEISSVEPPADSGD
jgi:hypothetical protein